MYLADPLSWTYLPEVNACTASQKLVDINHASSLALTTDRLLQFQYSSADNPTLQEFHKTIQHGWPESKSDVIEALHAYYDIQDELTVQGQ